MKKSKKIMVPSEMLELIEKAKKEYKVLTGKKKCSDPTALKYIAGATKLFKYRKFSFDKEEER